MVEREVTVDTMIEDTVVVFVPNGTSVPEGAFVPEDASVVSTGTAHSQSLCAKRMIAIERFCLRIG